jgi:hypothetical protein
MADYRIIQYTPDVDHAWGDADIYFCKADNGSKVTVVVLKKRSDGSPYRIEIKETE